jgi:hypothetical protein
MLGGYPGAGRLATETAARKARSSGLTCVSMYQVVPANVTISSTTVARNCFSSARAFMTVLNGP